MTIRNRLRQIGDECLFVDVDVVGDVVENVVDVDVVADVDVFVDVVDVDAVVDVVDDVSSSTYSQPVKLFEHSLETIVLHLSGIIGYPLYEDQ